MQIPNNSMTTSVTPVLANLPNAVKEEAITVQQNPNISPEIQAGLAQAEGNLLAVEEVPQNQEALDDAALIIAQDGTKNENERMKAAASIKNETKRDDAYLTIALSDHSLDDDDICIEAAGSITDKDVRDSVLLYIAIDTKRYEEIRLEAAEKITDENMRDKIFFTIALDSQINTSARVEAAKNMRDKTESNKLLYLLAINPSVDEYMRVEAANHITDGSKQNICNSILASIAQNSKDYDVQQQAVKAMKHNDQKEEASLKIVLDTLKNVNNDIRHPLIEVINFSNEISEDKIRDEMLKKICQNWPLIGQGEDLSSDINSFDGIYELASSESAKYQLIKIIVDNVTLVKEFRRIIVENNVKNHSEKEALLNNIDQEVLLKGSNIKGAHNVHL